MTHGLSESKVKVMSNHPLPAFPRKRSNDSGIKRRLVCVGKVVHPCRIIIFLKSRVHGYERLGDSTQDHRELEPNRKTWQINVCLRMLPPGMRGDPSQKMLMMIWWISKDDDQ